MKDASRPRLIAAALTLVATAGLYLALPGQPQAAASSCSETNNGNVCWENESCVNILFYKQCTTTHKYLPAAGSSDGGSGGSEGSDTAFEPAEGSGGCVWGRDYVGWAPRYCD